MGGQRVEQKPHRCATAPVSSPRIMTSESAPGIGETSASASKNTLYVFLLLVKVENEPRTTLFL